MMAEFVLWLLAPLAIGALFLTSLVLVFWSLLAVVDFVRGLRAGGG